MKQKEINERDADNLDLTMRISKMWAYAVLAKMEVLIEPLFLTLKAAAVHEWGPGTEVHLDDENDCIHIEHLDGRLRVERVEDLLKMEVRH
jgi:hypothetical protein